MTLVPWDEWLASRERARCATESADEAEPFIKMATAPAPAAVVRLPSLEELVLQWPRIEPMLRRATVRTGCYEPIDLLQLAMAGKLAIWFCEVDGSIEAALVTELRVYPRRRILEVLFGGGKNMRRWIEPAIAQFDAHARQLGCSHVAACGRRGWARAWRGRLTGDVIITRDVARSPP